MNPPTPPPDLRTREGCVLYVQNTLLPELVRVYGRTGIIHPHGYVFCAALGGNVLPSPQPHMVGQHGLQGRALRRALQQVANQASGIGAVLVRQDDFTHRATPDASLAVIVVQLEHKAFADLVWTAGVTRKTREIVFAGPVDLAHAEIEIKPLCALAARWMS